MHQGHRKNLRNDFLINGINGKTDHQILELILTYSLPRVDVNPIAHQLIDEFGSLAAVMDAPIDELIKINYITENSAVLLKLIPQTYQRYIQSKWEKRPKLNNLEKTVEFLKMYYISDNNEKLAAIFLDSHLQLISIEILSIGDKNSSAADIKKVIKLALKNDAKTVILAHNHPSGNVNPSLQDISVTNNIKETLAMVEISLSDHIILCGDNYFSFFKNNLI